MQHLKNTPKTRPIMKTLRGLLIKMRQSPVLLFLCFETFYGYSTSFRKYENAHLDILMWNVKPYDNKATQVKKKSAKTFKNEILQVF